MTTTEQVAKGLYGALVVRPARRIRSRASATGC